MPQRVRACPDGMKKLAHRVRVCGLMTRLAAILAAFFALASPAAAGVTSPQSGWYAGNPLLGPDDFADVACSGQSCYAAGGFGTLLYSSDGGPTWQGARTGLTDALQKVRTVGGDPRKLVVAGRCLLRRSDDGGGHFTRLPLAASDASCASPIASLAFPT